LAGLEGLWLKTGRDVKRQIFQYEVKILAITFGVGVVWWPILTLWRSRQVTTTVPIETLTLTVTLIRAGNNSIAIFNDVVMYGIELGIGILFPWPAKGDDRNPAINTIAPVWDGNEASLLLRPGASLL